MKVYDDIVKMQAALAEIQTLPTEEQRISELCEIAYNPHFSAIDNVDPFSEEYKSLVIELYKIISGHSSYQATVNELAPYLEFSDKTAGHYGFENTSSLGHFLTAAGQVLIALNAQPGHRVLEYGAGEGKIAIEAAKAGCNVTVVDIEPSYLKLVEDSAKSQHLNVETIQGEFGDYCGKFDRILFYEAFHHCLDHNLVAKKMIDMLLPGGYIVFAGEPIIGDHNEIWRPSLRYPWGLRLDGLSFRAIQTYGWMELGFDEDYFIEMLMRAGFLVEYRHCELSPRGSAYIARPYDDEINLGNGFLLPGGWHSGQGDHRWTAEDNSFIPLREHNGELEVALCNFSSGPREYKLDSDGTIVSGILQFSEVETVTIAACRRLKILTSAQADVQPDPRTLGIAIRHVKFI